MDRYVCIHCHFYQPANKRRQGTTALASASARQLYIDRHSMGRLGGRLRLTGSYHFVDGVYTAH